MHTLDTLLYLTLIIVAARAGGEIAERFHQPAVLGEIAAGVALGLIPAIRLATGSEAIVFIAEIGVILLLFEVGLESEFGEYVRVGTAASLVAVIGVVLPLFIGAGATLLLGCRPHEALFLGATLTATSVGVTARVMRDLRLSQSKEAKIVIGAAVVDDILGLLVLSVVLAVAGGTAVRAGGVVLAAVVSIVFLVGGIAIGIRGAPFLIELTRRMRGRGILTVSAFALALALAYLSGLIGLAPIVGAFAAGLVLASTRDRVRITEQIQPVADIFAPVFFATVGMQVDLTRLSPALPDNWPILGLALVLLAVAIPTKLLAGSGAIRQRVDKLAIGIAMVPRGEVGLIFATIGLQREILSRGLYGAIVLVVLITTLITPPWLKHRLSRTRGRAREAASSEE